MEQRLGYFRIQSASGVVNYMPYQEYYTLPDVSKVRMRTDYENRLIRLSCACCPDDSLELGITKANVIRVKTNKGQELHKDACPKSKVYESWVRKKKDGLLSIGEDGTFCFNITIPNDFKSPSSNNSVNRDLESKKEAKTDEAKKRANILDLIMNLNCYAWIKQTYSVKKKIKEAHKENIKPEWDYKDNDNFIRLMYGVSADINVCFHQQIYPLSALMYRQDKFYASDFRTKYIIYAKIFKMGEYKEERKYQYITLQMRSDKSPNKAAVRIPTTDIDREEYESIAQSIATGKSYIMTGYARHDTYKDKANTDTETSHWITMINHFILETTSIGLLPRNFIEKELYEALAEKHILFTRNIMPLAAYPVAQPTLIIEQIHGKDIIVDICNSKQEYEKISSILSESPQSQYDILLYVKKNVGAGDIIKDIFSIFERNKQRSK